MEERPDSRSCRTAARERPASHRARRAAPPRSPSAPGDLKHNTAVRAAARVHDEAANMGGENMMVEELKTFFTNFGLAALLLLIFSFSFQWFILLSSSLGDLWRSC